MAKITLTRLLETAQLLATEAGQQLAQFITYMSEHVEQTTRALQGGLSFADNFACERKIVSLKHNVAQLVSAKKPVEDILATRVFSSVHGLDSFAWYYDSGGRLTVKATFTGAPSGSLDVRLVLFF